MALISGRSALGGGREAPGGWGLGGASRRAGKGASAIGGGVPDKGCGGGGPKAGTSLPLCPMGTGRPWEGPVGRKGGVTWPASCQETRASQAPFGAKDLGRIGPGLHLQGAVGPSSTGPLSPLAVGSFASAQGLRPLAPEAGPLSSCTSSLLVFQLLNAWPCAAPQRPGLRHPTPLAPQACNRPRQHQPSHLVPGARPLAEPSVHFAPPRAPHISSDSLLDSQLPTGARFCSHG